MSAVSAGGGSSVTKLIARKLDKHVEAFGERLLDVPEGEVNLSNEGDVRKWLELAKNDVEKIRTYSRELADAGSTTRLVSVITDGLVQYDKLGVGLRELSTTVNLARSSSGASLRPEDSASHISSGSVARSSVLERSSHAGAPAGRQTVPEVPVVDFKRPAPRPRTTRSKVAPAVGSELISLQQRCETCVRLNKACVFSGDHTACDLCRAKKVRCAMPGADAPVVRSSSVASSAAKSIPSSLARGVGALGVSGSSVKTPSRSDKRKIEVGSSPEEQPPRRRSKTDLKEAGDVETGSEGGSGAGKTKAGYEDRIGRLERKLTRFQDLYKRSVEDLQADMKELREEMAEEVPQAKSKSKGKGKGKA